jgi:hypothetical protein
MLVEIARYHTEMRTVGDAYKINNDFRSRYARLIEERIPECQGRFVTRRISS